MKGLAFPGPFFIGKLPAQIIASFGRLCREQLFGRSGANHGCLRCRAPLPSPAFEDAKAGSGERKIEWAQCAGMLHLASKFKRTKISSCCPGTADGHSPTFGCQLIFAIHGPWSEVLDQGPAFPPSS